VVRQSSLILALLCSLALAFSACGKKDAQIRIGHGGGYLSAALYAAQDSFSADIQNFRSSSDTAYALLSGTLDAGFVEAEKLAAFAALSGFDKLTVAGKVTYPYGATLILRKGLNLRLHELGELTIAASAPECKLLKAFADDAKRLGADISRVKYKYMAFDAMIPALEAGVVDAAIIRGSYSVIALQEGHSILYQDWDVKPGDECCPAIIDQAILILLARREKLDAIKPITDALLSAQKLSPDELRHAVADNTVIPFEVLQGQPVPEFSLADDTLVEIFVEAAKEHGEGGEHEHGGDGHEEDAHGEDEHEEEK
jgi:ABC-type nitrate/sulfonate/bicarbonate transport system substrate-binding protein